MTRKAKANALWLLATFVLALAVKLLLGGSVATAAGVLLLAAGLRIVFVAGRYARRGSWVGDL